MAAEPNGVPESSEEPAADPVAVESKPAATGEPEELVDPKEVSCALFIPIISQQHNDWVLKGRIPAECWSSCCHLNSEWMRNG